MKRWLVSLLALLPLVAACGTDPEVIVHATRTDDASGETVAIADLPVRLLPYDRDALLDSLRAEADTPEPPIPPELTARLASLEAQPRQVNGSGDSASVQLGVLRARADSLREARRAWAEHAYADFDRAAVAALEASGRVEVADTTGVEGAAAFNVPAGRWWVYARYALPDAELYWNFPIEVTDPGALVSLTPANAERRPIL